MLFSSWLTAFLSSGFLGVYYSLISQAFSWLQLSEPWPAGFLNFLIICWHSHSLWSRCTSLKINKLLGSYSAADWQVTAEFIWIECKLKHVNKCPLRHNTKNFKSCRKSSIIYYFTLDSSEDLFSCFFTGFHNVWTCQCALWTMPDILKYMGILQRRMNRRAVLLCSPWCGTSPDGPPRWAQEVKS